MVGPLEDDDAAGRVYAAQFPDARAREAQRQVVGLAAGVDEEADGERRGHGGRELGRELRDVGVEVARVGVERPDLRRHRRGDLRVRVSDMADVVAGVQVPRARLVKEVLPLAPHDEERVRVLVRYGERLREVAFPPAPASCELRQARTGSPRRLMQAGRWVGGWAEGAQSVDLVLIQLLVRRGILILGLLQVGANGGEATPHVHAQRGCRPRPLPRLAWRTMPRAESSKDGKRPQ